jgi:hypothetical protein
MSTQLFLAAPNMKRNNRNKKSNFNLIGHNILFNEILNCLNTESYAKHTAHKQEQDISSMSNNHPNQIEAIEKIIERKTNLYSNYLAQSFRKKLQNESTAINV